MDSPYAWLLNWTCQWSSTIGCRRDRLSCSTCQCIQAESGPTRQAAASFMTTVCSLLPWKTFKVLGGGHEYFTQIWMNRSNCFNYRLTRLLGLGCTYIRPFPNSRFTWTGFEARSSLQFIKLSGRFQSTSDLSCDKIPKQIQFQSWYWYFPIDFICGLKQKHFARLFFTENVFSDSAIFDPLKRSPMFSPFGPIHPV